MQGSTSTLHLHCERLHIFYKIHFQYGKQTSFDEGLVHFTTSVANSHFSLWIQFLKHLGVFESELSSPCVYAFQDFFQQNCYREIIYGNTIFVGHSDTGHHKNPFMKIHARTQTQRYAFLSAVKLLFHSWIYRLSSYIRITKFFGWKFR